MLKRRRKSLKLGVRGTCGTSVHWCSTLLQFPSKSTPYRTTPAPNHRVLCKLGVHSRVGCWCVWLKPLAQTSIAIRLLPLSAGGLASHLDNVLHPPPMSSASSPPCASKLLIVLSYPWFICQSMLSNKLRRGGLTGRETSDWIWI